MKQLFLAVIFSQFFSTCIFAQEAGIVIDSNKRISLKQNAIISQLLVGTWKDQNSVMTFSADGTFSTVFDSIKLVQTGRWKVEPRKLLLYDDDVIGLLGIPWTYNLLEFTPRKFMMQLNKSEDTTIWIVKRIR